MKGTWTQTGPGRSVYRPASSAGVEIPAGVKIPADALNHLFNPVTLAAVQRSMSFWGSVRERWDRMAERRTLPPEQQACRSRTPEETYAVNRAEQKRGLPL